MKTCFFCQYDIQKGHNDKDGFPEYHVNVFNRNTSRKIQVSICEICFQSINFCVSLAGFEYRRQISAIVK